MSWHFLQAEAEASWLEISLDGAPSALLSLIPGQEGFSLIGNETESLSDSPFGMTSEHLTAGHGTESLMSSPEDSPARTSASAEKAPVLMGRDQDYGWKWRESFARYSPSSSSWKIRQCSLLEGLDESLEIWPEWGWMRDGECLELPRLERPIIERGFSWLLTPTAQAWKAWTFRNPLALIRKNHADGNLQEQLMRLYRRMTTPRCQEILMMWPEGWTDSRPLAMDGFRKWQQEHGQFF